MKTRVKGFALILLVFFLVGWIPVEVTTGEIWTFYAPAQKPHDDVILVIYNGNPFDTYAFRVTVYDGTFQVVSSVDVQVLPLSVYSDYSEDWCEEVGGLAKATFERLDTAETDDLHAGVMFSYPCDGDPLWHGYIPLLVRSP